MDFKGSMLDSTEGDVFLKKMTKDLKMNGISYELRKALLNALIISLKEDVALLVEVEDFNGEKFEIEFIEVADGDAALTFGQGHTRLISLSRVNSFKILKRLEKSYLRDNKTRASEDEHFLEMSDLRAIRCIGSKLEKGIPAYAEFIIENDKKIEGRVFDLESESILCMGEEGAYIDIFHINGLRRIKEKKLELVS